VSVEEHLGTFHGLPVVDFQPSHAGRSWPEPGWVAWRLSVEDPFGWDPTGSRTKESFPQLWERFLTGVDASRVRAIVFGVWDSSAFSGLADLRGLLIEAAPRLPELRAVFLGDLVREESDIAYIRQCDPAPLFAAFPLLEEFGARGTPEGCGPLDHPRLHTLRFESGGLPVEVVRAVGRAQLPNLHRLDLWLGVEDYGGTSEPRDFEPLLAAGRFPKLRHLMLGDSEAQDDIAAVVAGASVVAQLENLSLAMGTLTDEGAEALLAGQPLTHLKRLDLHHHFLSEPMSERIRQALEPAGVRVDLSERQEAEDDGDEIWRYVAVSE
jgi:hypothetical protein